MDIVAAESTNLFIGSESAPRQVVPGVRVCVLADADGSPIGLRGR